MDEQHSCRIKYYYVLIIHDLVTDFFPSLTNLTAIPHQVSIKQYNAVNNDLKCIGPLIASYV